MIDNRFAVERRFPNTEIHTTFFCGIDYGEIAPAPKAREPEIPLGLVMKRRSSEINTFALRASPAFTGLAQPRPLAPSLPFGLPADAITTQPSRKEASDDDR